LSNLATDPCQGANINRADANRPGTLSNLCLQTGVPLSSIGNLQAPSAGQINNLTGGNAALGPESAKTKTIGFVIEPLPRLAISVDYYQIDIADAVSTPSTTDILDRCYSAAQNPGFTLNDACGMVGRNTINGSFNGGESRGVATPRSNLGSHSTSGVDLNVSYRLAASRLGLDARYGNFDISLGANQVNRYEFQATPRSVLRDCLGYYSVACNNVVSAPVYKRKFNQRTNWSMGAWSVGYNWRYVSGVIEEPGGTVYLPQFSSIPAYHYVDLNANWNINKNVRVSLSVTNAANKKPPIVGGTIGGTASNSGNTFPQSYDAVGRYVTLGASVKF
jgi:outer membrane receptor protein involved in Fe transport